jgi:signal transduction histidine kinase
VLQYQWGKQLRAATELQIGSNLQSVMTSWQRDLYDELSAICIALQVGPDSGAHDAWNDYLQRYADWDRDGVSHEVAGGLYANPDLIREIYIWQTSIQPVQLLRLNPQSKGVDIAEVPKEYGDLLKRLANNSSDLRQAFRAWESSNSAEDERSASIRPNPARRGTALAGWQFESKIPAIVHPLLHHRDPFNDRTPVNAQAFDWLVVVLDIGTLQNRILPELTSRYFGQPGELEYNLAMISDGPPARIIYSSDANFKLDDADEFDSVMNVFGWSTRDAMRYANSEKDRRGGHRNEWRNFAAPVWFPVIRYGSGNEPWLLVLQHRTTPVEAVASRVWHRDLVIGSVVLLLLAANMTLVVLAGIRAQQFARVQMEFVASVSHELRTPLAAIFSASENIRDGFVEGRDSLKFYGSLLTSQTRQLTDLVDRIMLFASTRERKTQYTLRPLDVSEVLKAVRKNTVELVEGAGFRIEERIDRQLPPVLGDMAGVCACMQNLISNAIKYGGQDHWIGITASLHASDTGSSEVRINVEDHGPGISGSELPHIFEPFYRSPAVVNAQIHGTGLGLALTKEIAETLGGKVSVVSRLGTGSMFTLHLRVADEAKENPGASVSEMKSVSKDA